MKLINADLVVHWEAYDDEHETFQEHEGTIADFLDQMTDEGCPEGVDAVPVVTGTWKAVTDDGENYKRICTCCGKEAPFDELEGVYLIYPHCPWCGADMRKDGDYYDTV